MSVAAKLFNKYGSSTMCNRDTFITNIDLVWRFQSIPGAIVECGVWRGGMIAAIAEMMGNARHYVLADSFQGLPPAKQVDGKAAIEWQASDPDNCRAKADEAVASMAKAGITNYEVLEGWFTETLKKVDAPIAVLRLDADWYDSTLFCLRTLFDKVAVGGLAIIDDYYVWDGCSRAVHTFLHMHNRTERLRVHNGVAYLVKQ